MVEVDAAGSYDPDQLADRLAALGYTRCQQVEGVGQFALRGGILDVFSPGMDDPVRIEFWDGSLRPRSAATASFCPAPPPGWTRTGTPPPPGADGVRRWPGYRIGRGLLENGALDGRHAVFAAGMDELMAVLSDRCSLPTSTTAAAPALCSWVRSAAAASRLAPKEESLSTRTTASAALWAW